MSFEDILEANQTYAASFKEGGYDGIAHAGIAIVTCMDSRIEPLAMLGLGLGDAKILRTPGGRVYNSTMTGLALAVQLLKVNRIMLVPHTHCAMASGTDDDLRTRITDQQGPDSSWMNFGASPDQHERLQRDLRAVSSHPLIRDRAEVGGFMYDVDTGLLERLG